MTATTLCRLDFVSIGKTDKYILPEFSFPCLLSPRALHILECTVHDHAKSLTVESINYRMELHGFLAFYPIAIP